MRNGVNSTWHLSTGACRNTVKITAAKFYDLQGCIFKILLYVNQNSVSLHQAKESDTYIHSWKAKGLCRYWENKRMLPWTCAIKYKPQVLYVPLLTSLWGAGFWLRLRWPSHGVGREEQVSRCLCWTATLPSHLCNVRFCLLGELEEFFGQTAIAWGKWACFRVQQVSFCCLAFSTCWKVTNYSLFPFDICSLACLLMCNVLS